MTRNCDLGLFPRLIEQWKQEEAARAVEEARRIQLASRPKFNPDKTRKKFFMDLLTTSAAVIGVFINYALFIICFG